MKVLIACEESQEVCKAFRDLGHEAFSCDLEECSGGHPEWHILGDALSVINPIDDGEFTGICFSTMDDAVHVVERWGLIIAHPPCTFLSNAGASNPYQKWATDDYRANWFRNRDLSFDFFMQFVNADCDRIAIENPPGYVSSHYRKPDQIIHPYEYGHPVRKATCLWLYGLPKLQPTKIVDKGEMTTWGKKNPKRISVWYKEETRRGGSASRNRSKTFTGIARAMAEQWGKVE